MSKMLTFDEIENLDIKKKFAKCNLCSNSCGLTVHTFNKERYITGNRCDKPLKKKKKRNLHNMYEYKYERIFDYAPLPDNEAVRGQIGIPRVLNMYEHYPFWFTFFNNLKFQVLISSRSSKYIYELGMDTIPSESLCYPAKLTNGHIQDLIDRDVKTIFYPSIMYEKGKEKKFSCPVVMSYPEVISRNMDTIEEENIDFIHPFLVMHDNNELLNSLVKLCKEKWNISKQDVETALNEGLKELELVSEHINLYGDQALKAIEKFGNKGVVLSGRPYHLDPELNHGIDSLIASQDMVVLTEDFIATKESSNIKLRVIDQWEYHARLYKAASVVGKNDSLELIQLNSFGCGLDAITTDQVKEILDHHNKVYTCLKIDEGDNLGAAKIRIRSLKAAISDREKLEIKPVVDTYEYEYAKLDTDLSEYKIFAPQMSPIHFDFIQTAFRTQGYDIDVLPAIDKEAIEYGIKFVNNDSCYPALVVIGQLLEAVDKYKGDKKIALLITQTGGACRATNYIALLRKALTSAGYPDIPVLSLNAGNVDDENSMNLKLPTMKRAFLGIMYGDIFMNVLYRMRPYEKNKGQTQRMYEEWVLKAQENILDGSIRTMRKNIRQIIKDFDNIPICSEKKPRVGIVGEILVKYHPSANSNLVEVIEENGGEAVVPGLLDFFLYSLYNGYNYNKEFKKTNFTTNRFIIEFVERFRGFIKTELKKSDNFDTIHSIKDTARKASDFLDLGNISGEGWFLTGEMVNLIEDNVPNIVCTQPFGCLPNHITGKGMFKAINKKYPQANLCPIDYDPGASEVNQISRIKLMMSVAKKNLKKENNI